MDILFVHGTGVRLVSYDLTLSLVRRQAKKYLDLACVHQCLWGDPHGARLNQGGASVPAYADQPAPVLSAFEAERIDEASWRMLVEDPLFEIRLLQGLAVPTRELGPNDTAAGETSIALLKTLEPSAAFMEALTAASLESFWPAAYQAIANDPELSRILRAADRDPREVSRALARALVASLVQCAMDGGHPGISGMRRTLLVNFLIPNLGQQPLARLAYKAPLGTGQSHRNGPGSAEPARAQRRHLLFGRRYYSLPGPRRGNPAVHLRLHSRPRPGNCCSRSQPGGHRCL